MSRNKICQEYDTIVSTSLIKCPLASIWYESEKQFKGIIYIDFEYKG